MNNRMGMALLHERQRHGFGASHPNAHNELAVPFDDSYLCFQACRVKSRPDGRHVLSHDEERE